MRTTLKTRLLTAILVLFALSGFGQVPNIKRMNYGSKILPNQTEPDSKIKLSNVKDSLVVFKTTDIINYNYLDSTKRVLKGEVKHLMIIIYKNSLGKIHEDPVKITSIDIRLELKEIDALKDSKEIIEKLQNVQIESLRKFKIPEVYLYVDLERKSKKLLDSISNSENVMDKNSKPSLEQPFDHNIRIAEYEKIKKWKKKIQENYASQIELLKIIRSKNASEAIIFLNLEKQKEKVKSAINIINIYLVKATKNEMDSAHINYSNSSGEQILQCHKRKLDSIVLLEHQMDSLYLAYTEDYLNHQKLTVAFGPYRSRAFYNLIYGNGGSKVRTLTTSGFTFGDNFSSLNT
ncbi:MAG: hypothetical protein N4A46_05800 [Schleiferiaceae bacterium]|jgi:hypothetical protein|nr:hypothetical protein [Schleiferiaceae bacterium]